MPEKYSIRYFSHLSRLRSVLFLPWWKPGSCGFFSRISTLSKNRNCTCISCDYSTNGKHFPTMSNERGVEWTFTYRHIQGKPLHLNIKTYLNTSGFKMRSDTSIDPKWIYVWSEVVSGSKESQCKKHSFGCFPI
jgi:hypothetical protein